MKLMHSLTPAAIAVTLALAATPAFAQREHENRGGEQRAQQRGGEQRGGEQRGQQRGGEQRGQARGGEQRAQPSGGDTRGTAGRVENRGGQYRGGENRGAVENRGGYENRGGDRGVQGRAVPRTNEYRSRAYVEPRGYGYGRPHADIYIRRYDRPYFLFRPRYLIGYGLYLGYPVPYPLVYGAPTYVYGYPYGEVSAAQLPPDSYGGVALDVTPDDAQVIVDGAAVGIARDFSSSYQPLTLTPGRHHIELQAAGAVPLAFDVDVVPGQVIPYRGTLQPQ